MVSGKTVTIPVSPARLCFVPTADFDAKRDIAAGPWVFLDALHAGDWHLQQSQQGTYASLDEMKADASLALSKVEQLSAVIFEELNRRNATSHDAVFWRVMALPWLLSIVQIFLERRRRVLSIVQRFGNEPIQVDMVFLADDWPFETTADFFNHGVFNKDFNAWIFSEILRKHMPMAWQSRDVSHTPPALAPPLGKKSRIKLALASRCQGVYGFGIADKLLFSCLLALKPRKPRREIPRPGPQPFADAEILEKLIWQCLPKFLSNLSQWAPDAPRTRKGKTAITARLFFSPHEKYMAACRAEAGERLFSAQHGGGYGNLALFSFIDALEYPHDGFISWGWREHPGHQARGIPLPSPYLSKFRRTPSGRNIIFVGAFMSPYFYRLDSRPQPTQFAAYAGDKLQFLAALSPAVQSDIFYRPFPSQPGTYDDAAFMRANRPDAKFCEGDLHPQLMGARLVVLDNPGTTLNITMAANVPTLAFWDPAIWEMTAESEKLFDRLRAVGILHNDPVSAARHLNAISDDVAAWWNATETQTARQAWAQEFARASPRWRREWISALWKS